MNFKDYYTVFLFLFTNILFAQFSSDFQKGVTYLELSKADSALYYFQKFKNEHATYPDSTKGILQMNLGKAYKLKTEYAQSLEHLEKAEKIFKKLQLQNRLAELYIFFAEFYRAKYDFNFSQKYLKLAKEIIDTSFVSPENIAYYWNRKAAIYTEKEDDYYNSIKCSEKVIAIAQKIHSQSLKASSLNEIGYAYENLNNPKAEIFYKKSLSLFEIVGDSIYQANVLANLVRLYAKQERIKDAKEFIDKGLQISQKKQYNIFLKTFNLLNYHYYKKTGDFEQALKYHENYQELEKEEFIKKWNSQLIEAERKYESDKKDSEIAIKELSLKNQSNELKNSKIKLVSSLGILAVSIMITIIIITFYRKTKKSNKTLQNLSHENEFLLSEANHRINNNLQLIIALLTDELRKIEKRDERDSIKKVLSKVETISTLHRHLYQSNDKRKIQIFDYLNEIRVNFQDIFSANHITAIFNIEKFSIQTDLAMYLGLLLTELCINSVKHAYTKEQTEKLITFDLTIKNNILTFRYTDNGTRSKTKEFNPKLISKLCTQIKTDYTIKITNGFLFYFEKQIKNKK